MCYTGTCPYEHYQADSMCVCRRGKNPCPMDAERPTCAMDDCTNPVDEEGEVCQSCQDKLDELAEFEQEWCDE